MKTLISAASLAISASIVQAEPDNTLRDTILSIDGVEVSSRGSISSYTEGYYEFSVYPTIVSFPVELALDRSRRQDLVDCIAQSENSSSGCPVIISAETRVDGPTIELLVYDYSFDKERN